MSPLDRPFARSEDARPALIPACAGRSIALSGKDGTTGWRRATDAGSPPLFDRLLVGVDPSENGSVRCRRHFLSGGSLLCASRRAARSRSGPPMVPPLASIDARTDGPDRELRQRSGPFDRNDFIIRQDPGAEAAALFPGGCTMAAFLRMGAWVLGRRAKARAALARIPERLTGRGFRLGMTLGERDRPGYRQGKPGKAAHPAGRG